MAPVWKIELKHNRVDMRLGTKERNFEKKYIKINPFACTIVE